MLPLDPFSAVVFVLLLVAMVLRYRADRREIAVRLDRYLGPRRGR